MVVNSGSGQIFFVRTGRLVEILARFVAFLGGLALLAIALITLVSVIGRALIPLGLSPLRGQFELVQAISAFVVCAFLPWAHLKRGHASVAIFTDYLGHRANTLIDLAGDALLFIIACILTWQHTLGLFDKVAFGETTFLLRLPLWWAYAACLIGLCAWIIVGFWATWDSANRVLTKQPVSLSGSVGRK